MHTLVYIRFENSRMDIVVPGTLIPKVYTEFILQYVTLILILDTIFIPDP